MIFFFHDHQNCKIPTLHQLHYCTGNDFCNLILLHSNHFSNLFRSTEYRTADSDDNSWDSYFDGHRKDVDKDIGRLSKSKENYNEPGNSEV